jgi:hypothetical protein
MATMLENLIALQAALVQELKDDVDNGYNRPDYSLDGESVSREAWRAGMYEKIDRLYDLINKADTFEVRSYGE